MDGITLKIKRFFAEGHERTLRAKKNIAISFLLKGTSVVIGFLLIPMTIKYVNQVQYGIWITLSSIIGWFSFFDIGLGNGLKNKVAEANALKDHKQARIYVSTTYAILSIIAFFVLVAFFCLNHFISWAKILNAPAAEGDMLNNLALLVVGIFCFQFVVQIINILFVALHSPAKVSFLNVCGQICSITIIYFLVNHTQGSLNYLVFVFGGVPLLVQLIASIFVFNTSYKFVAPSFKLINFKYSRELLTQGSMFFLIQIGALLLFQTDNIITTQLFGPAYVTKFSIVYKLFSAITMVFAIIMTPFWAAFTDAYIKGELAWIKDTIKKIYKILAYVSIGAVVLLFVSPILYRYWIGKSFSVPFLFSLSMCLYVIGYCAVMLSCYLLNGTGKIRLQLYLYIISTLINIPLAFVLAKFIGLAGITLSNVIILVFMGIVLHIQCNKVINNTATGIWNK